MQTVTGLARIPMCPRLDEASRRIGQRRDATRAPNWGRSSRFRGSRKGALPRVQHWPPSVKSRGEAAGLGAEPQSVCAKPSTRKNQALRAGNLSLREGSSKRKTLV